MPVASSFGHDFRSTSGFVMDNSPFIYSNGTDAYPTGGGYGITSGSGNVNPRDYDAGFDPRLAGSFFMDANTQAVWQYDLPASGQYDISLALGHQLGDVTNMRFEVLDNTSSLFIITQGTITAGHLVDANGNDWGAPGTWVSNQTTRRITMSSTTLVFKVGQTSSSVQNAVRHFSFAAVAGGSGTLMAQSVF